MFYFFNYIQEQIKHHIGPAYQSDGVLSSVFSRTTTLPKRKNKQTKKTNCLVNDCQTTQSLLSFDLIPLTESWNGLRQSYMWIHKSLLCP